MLDVRRTFLLQLEEMVCGLIPDSVISGHSFKTKPFAKYAAFYVKIGNTHAKYAIIIYLTIKK